MKNGHPCSYSEEFGRKAYEVSLECSKRCHLTELVHGKRRVKENGTHIKTYNGNWGVSPLFGCLILLASRCSFSSAVSTSITFGEGRVGPASLEE